jgi:ABC-2 type transport system permease protein
VLGRLLGGTLLTFALVLPLIGLGYLTHYVPYCGEDSTAPLWAKVFLSGPCAWMLPPISWTHSLALAALLVAVTTMTVGLGTMLGLALRSARLVTMAGLNLAAFLFFLGGGFTTVAFLPPWLQVASRFIPTSYAIEGLRQALFYPQLTGFGHDLMVLMACAVGSIVTAAVLLSRSWRTA